MGSAKFAKEMNALKEHLGKHQLKFTRQREMILTAFLRQEHITAEAMYHQLAKTDPHLGLATIYRTLNLFCDAGIAQARDEPRVVRRRMRADATDSIARFGITAPQAFGVSMATMRPSSTMNSRALAASTTR